MLPTSTVTLLAGRVQTPGPEDYARFCDPALRARLDRGRPLDRDRTFTGRRLLVRLLEQNEQELPLPPELRYGPEGKPFLPDLPDWHFNLSHSGDWVVCALANRPVGVDLETERPLRTSILRRFAPAEQEMLRCLPESAFFDLWTVKEAFCKCTGQGLRLPLNATTVTLDPLSIDRAGYQVALVPFCAPEVHLALCVEGASPVRFSLCYG